MEIGTWTPANLIPCPLHIYEIFTLVESSSLLLSKVHQIWQVPWPWLRFNLLLSKLWITKSQNNTNQFNLTWSTSIQSHSFYAILLNLLVLLILYCSNIYSPPLYHYLTRLSENCHSMSMDWFLVTTHQNVKRELLINTTARLIQIKISVTFTTIFIIFFSSFLFVFLCAQMISLKDFYIKKKKLNYKVVPLV